ADSGQADRDQANAGQPASPVSGRSYAEEEASRHRSPPVHPPVLESRAPSGARPRSAPWSTWSWLSSSVRTASASGSETAWVLGVVGRFRAAARSSRMRAPLLLER